jgi:hypothetical protein
MSNALVIANILLVVATFLLVGVTACYAWHTRQTVKLMHEQMIASVRPVLVFAHEEKGHNNRLMNEGPGLALNCLYVYLAQDRQGTWEEKRWELPPIRPGHEVGAFPAFDEQSHALLTYEDVFGCEYWSRYCPKRDRKWQIGQGRVAPGDFACKCKLDEKGHVLE